MTLGQDERRQPSSPVRTCPAIEEESSQDGWRDGEHVRHVMDRRLRAELTGRGLPHVVVSGPPGERLAAAVRAVDDLIAAGRHFASPL